MNRKPGYTFYLFLVFIVWMGLTARAAVIHVTTTRDNVEGSLRAAITTANSNGENDTLYLPAGIYILSGDPGDNDNLSGDLDIDNSNKITIIGDSYETTIIDGSQSDRVLHILSGTVSLSGVTIRKGRTPDGTPGNLNGGSGGGIYNNGQLTLTGCTIIDNITGKGHNGCENGSPGDSGSGGYGGGIYSAGTLTLTNCIIKNNLTGAGGGGYEGYKIGHGGDGGGIYNSGTQHLTNCTIGNNATGNGFQQWCSYSPRAASNGGYGGGIYNCGTQYLTGCSINGNTAGWGEWLGDNGKGGGIYNKGQGTISHCGIKNNNSGGGGLCNCNTLTITNCTIDGNTSDHGGGIYNTSETGSTGQLSLINCTISNNNTGRATYYKYNGGDGGGIYNAGTMSLTNCTISNNKTGDGGSQANGGNGGGIYNGDGGSTGSLVLTGCTISFNNTGKGGTNNKDGSGGGICIFNGTVIIKNTIVALNQVAERGEGPDCKGIITSHGYNLIKDTTACTISGEITGNITGVDPKLDGLAYNGGPTQTHALLPGSPAIDAGYCSGTSNDQRGYSRPVDIPGIANANDGADIGAYEAPASYTISGRITHGETGLCNVTLSFSNKSGTAATDSNGNYSHKIIFGWSGTVTPSKSGYTFIPANKIYTSVNSHQTNMDYTAISTVPSQISLNRTQLYFGADTAGHRTGPQTILIANSGGSTLNWTIDTNANWLNCTPTSGSNSGVVTVSVDPSGLSIGTDNGTIIVQDPNASNSPRNVTVTLKVYDTHSSQAPFGSFDTPLHGSTVRSSIPVTGWAIDNIGIENVKIYRDPVPEEGSNLIYIGDAVLVEGARPDVEALYPDYPMNYKAGWGYMMLTNSLPNQGNGTFTIHAKAADKEGNIVILGKKTIICDNINAVKPFGAIDTPAQGGTASGSNFVNFGWALTPLPGKIPTDGSTITVWVDGLPLGHPVYNRYRADIAALFPGYNNSNGAVGYYYLDTTRYENGVHTIQWTVTDDAGNTDGIGSRFFTIQNAGESSRQSVVNSHWSMEKMKPSPIPLDNSEPVRIKKGYDNTDSQIAYPDDNGRITIEIKELERLEIHLFDPGESTLNITPLPIGSTFDSERCIFYWQPGPGFIGTYQFVFTGKTKTGEVLTKTIVITINPGFLKE